MKLPTKCILCVYLMGLLFLCLWVPKHAPVKEAGIVMDCGWGFVWKRPAPMWGTFECRAANKVDFGRVALAMLAWSCAVAIGLVLTRK